jgi:DNA-directed RNA polymerase subunit E'/Rpb7
LIRMNINHVIQDRLIKGMQGKCKAPLFWEQLNTIDQGSAKDGFVIKLKRVVDITGGAIEQRTGSVTYHVKYLAQCLRPRASHTILDCPSPNGNCDHQGDTVEAIVGRVLKMGIFADLGPLS